MRIQALNNKGKKALKQHINERKKQSKFNPQRLMYEKFFSETIINEDPFILEIKIKNKVMSAALRFEDLKNRIEETLVKNGATTLDFLIMED